MFKNIAIAKPARTLLMAQSFEITSFILSNATVGSPLGVLVRLAAEAPTALGTLL